MILPRRDRWKAVVLWALICAVLSYMAYVATTALAPAATLPVHAHDPALADPRVAALRQAADEEGDEAVGTPALRDPFARPAGVPAVAPPPRRAATVPAPLAVEPLLPSLAAPVPPTGTPVATPAASSAEPVPSITLKGVIAGEPPVAVVEVDGQTFYKLQGEQLGDERTTLVHISDGGIVVRAGSRNYTLDVGSSVRPVPPTLAGPPRAEPPAVPVGNPPPSPAPPRTAPSPTPSSPIPPVRSIASAANGTERQRRRGWRRRATRRAVVRAARSIRLDSLRFTGRRL